jgi:hypothetical protein
MSLALFQALDEDGPNAMIQVCKMAQFSIFSSSWFLSVINLKKINGLFNHLSIPNIPLSTISITSFTQSCKIRMLAE